MTAISWSDLIRHRKSIKRRFGEIWDLPLAKRYHSILLAHVRDGSRVLEIGAGARGLKDKLEKKFSGIGYKSFDIDNKQHHDFYSLEEVEGCFDLVCMFEVIEHMQPEDAFQALRKSYEHLDEGGFLVVSTPNIYYPPGFLRDVTHISPWCYDELGGIVEQAGFEVSAIYRLFQDSILKKFVKRFICYPLYRILGIDFSKQILVVGKKVVGKKTTSGSD